MVAAVVWLFVVSSSAVFCSFFFPFPFPFGWLPVELRVPSTRRQPAQP
jgi:hypothetical protein